MGKITLEKEVLFSESLLWKLQENAYRDFGVSAWVEKGVPSYLTSHPLTAYGYAKSALAFLEELQSDKPVTVIDLGAGTGRFAYLFLQEFIPHVDQPVTYLHTDISEENLEFIEQHPFMQPYKDILKAVPYRHDDKDWNVDIDSFEGPVIVISNYYFDTLPQTLYQSREGRLYEGRVTTVVDEEFKDAGLKIIPHLECSYTYTPVLDHPLISEYASILDDATFIVPTGGLETIAFIRSKAKGPLLWITADQAVTTLSQALTFTEPKIAHHGTFSVSVSYHFLHWYFQEHLRATVITTDNPDPAYTVMASILGSKGDKVAKAFRETIEALEPIEYFRLGSGIDGGASLETIMALIHAGRNDPINTHLYFDAIRSKMQHVDINQKNRLIYLLERVRENFYPISRQEGEFLMNLGVLFFELESYAKALFCFEQSIIFTGPSMKTSLNIAACRDKL